MTRALAFADRAAECGEVPVGAVVVLDGEEIGSGFNRPIMACDPSAHAEVVALRAAAIRQSNYRLPGSTLYATMEPCPMCFGALVQARVARVVYGATDSRWGVLGSVIDLGQAGHFNHQVDVTGGVLADECAGRLRQFFRSRRQASSGG